MGRPEQTWDKASKKTKKRQTQAIAREIETFVKNTKVEGEPIDEHRVLGFLLSRNYNHQKLIAGIGKKLDQKDVDVTGLPVLPVEVSAYLMSLNLGKTTMRKIKSAFKQSKFGKVSSFEEVSDHVNKEVLPIKYHDIQDLKDPETQIGMRFDTADFLKNHMKRFVICQERKGKALGGGHYKMHLKMGYDTSRHTRYSFKGGAPADVENPTISIGLTDLMVLSVESAGPGTDDYFWKEPTPNSSNKTRVLGILEKDEKDPETLAYLLLQQKELMALQENGVQFTYKGVNYTFLPEICPRMDGKLNKILMGINAPDACLKCEASKEEWSDPKNIGKKFKRRGKVEELKQFYSSLPRTKKGKLKKTTNDYKTRKGFTHAPQTLMELFNFTVTHKWVHLIHFDAKLWERLVTNHKEWNKSKGSEKKLKEAKKKLIEILKAGNNKPGVQYDWPDNR